MTLTRRSVLQALAALLPAGLAARVLAEKHGNALPVHDGSPVVFTNHLGECIDPSEFNSEWGVSDRGKAVETVQFYEDDAIDAIYEAVTKAAANPHALEKIGVAALNAEWDQIIARFNR
jgi:hypothetical protein